MNKCLASNSSLFPEWIETDGEGGYALGTSNLINLRRYHSLYTIALNPPRERVAILKCFDMRLLVDGKETIFSNLYFGQDDFKVNSDLKDLEFNTYPFPTFLYTFRNGIKLKQSLFIEKVSRKLFINFKITFLPKNYNIKNISLVLRPLLSGNNHHHLLKNKIIKDNYLVEKKDDSLSIFFKELDKTFILKHNAKFSLEENTYKNLYYSEEKNRGFDYLENLFLPGALSFSLENEALLSFLEEKKEGSKNDLINNYETALEKELKIRTSLEEKTRQHFIVRSKKGSSIIAGYPWFTDWGRDTFIALRGLCLAKKDYKNTENIIFRWIEHISDGMIPNRFTDYGPVEYNSVDASLWLIICGYELITQNLDLELDKKTKILEAIDNILNFYFKGTRHNIICDKEDGLLSQGEEGYALTWMDARVNGKPVTQRLGKAIEIQALWINALTISAKLLNSRQDLLDKAKKSLKNKFWIESKGYFKDLINLDTENLSFRPNQIFLIGGLPFSIASEKEAKLVLGKIEQELYTPFGLRSLAKSDKEYVGNYQGNSYKRDSVYHQGTSWGFLLGPYFEAYLRVNNFSENSKKEVNLKLNKFEELFNFKGCGQSYEIYDGDHPFKERGCPYQAWTLGEYLRIKELVN